MVVRPGGGDRPGAVRAQAVGDDELPLADRRQAAGRHTGGDPVRQPLAGHAEGGVLLDDQHGRLEHPSGHRRRGHRDHQAQGRRRRPHGHRRCHTRRGGHAGRADRRVRDRHPSGPGGRRHAVLHRPGQLGEPEPGGDPDVSRRRGADQVRDQALSARRRISAGSGPPKDLVALCSEAIVTSLPDPVLHRRRSVRIGIRLRHSAPRSLINAGVLRRCRRGARLATTHRSATWPDALRPVHRHNAGARELPIGSRSRTIAVALRHER